MARSAYDDAVWVPGQPLDPGADTMEPKELTDRLLFIEKAFTNMLVGDLPLGQLQKTLEQEWLPDASTLFAGGAIGNDSLAFALYYAQIGSGGTIVLASNPKVLVVRNSLGNYTITYPPFKVTPIVLALPQVALASPPRYASKTATSVNIILSADSDFDFMVVGK